MAVSVDVRTVEVTHKQDVWLAVPVVGDQVQRLLQFLQVVCISVWHVEGPHVEVLQVLELNLHLLHLAVCD